MTYRILCADDEQLVRDALKLFLESISLRVRCVDSGRRCVEEFQAAPDGFDLVFVNFDMPGMTGVEVARILRTIRADVRVVLISGFSAKEIAQHSGEPKFAYLPKPFRRAELRRFLQSTLVEAEPSIAALASADADMAALLAAPREEGLDVEEFSEVDALVSAARSDFRKVALIDLRDPRATLPLLEQLRADQIPLVVANASEDDAGVLRGLGVVVLPEDACAHVVSVVREAAHGELHPPERSH